MLTTKDVLLEKLYDVKYDRIEQGLGLDVSEVDEFLRFKKGAFNICIGHANTGKTTTILYMMMAYSLKHNLKWLIFSSENTDYSVARKLLEFKTGTPIQKLPDADIETELNWINSHFKIINVDKIYTARSLMKEAKAIKEAWNYDGLLIDPYNSLIKDPALLRSVGGQIASEMRLFCKEENVSMWLNCHCVTEALRRVHSNDHVFAGYPKPPSMADVEGGGKWGNRADDVIAIHRYTQHPDRWMVSDIHVRKVSLRMMPSNVSFTVAGRDLITPKKINIDKLEF